MTFEIGQKYAAKSDGAKVAEVMQIDDDGRKAFVHIRDQTGNLVNEGPWVVHAQFIGAWALI